MLLKVEDVEFSYNGTKVLKRVSFEIEKGKVAAILGPNGAGKSTLLKCINRVLKLKKGVVMIEDVSLSLLGELDIAKKMGYVPQNNSGSFMTVFDTILLGRKPHIRWEAREKDFKIVEETLKLLGLEDFALRPTNSLSGGELQKVMLARALVQEPELLLLDEPTNNLDVKNQIEVMKIINRITHEKDITSIVVMHDINLALRYAEKFIVMKDGKIYATGEKDIIKPDLIRKVYKVEALIENVRGFPVIIPL